MKIMGRQENEEAGKKVRAWPFSRRARRICCGAFHPFFLLLLSPALVRTLPFSALLSAIFAFFPGKAAAAAARWIAGNHDHVQREATACFSCSFPVLFARGNAPHAILFHPHLSTSPLLPHNPRRRPDNPREKRLVEHENLKRTASPATATWTWQVRGEAKKTILRENKTRYKGLGTTSGSPRCNSRSNWNHFRRAPRVDAVRD